jgi:DEAD/DEAH box helicase domain-containing protein
MVESSHSLEKLLFAWNKDPEIYKNIVYWRQEPERLAEWAAIPGSLTPETIAALHKSGLERLYGHQAEAVRIAQAGKNFVVTTGTASGKTLCYQLPVIDQLVRDPNARALFIFPTKALAQDQLNSLNALVGHLEPKPAAFIYDGDTSTALRPKARGTARVILTNPDMAHISILPHHTIWADFFRNLRFVVIDEVHIYRGIFGSHLANLIRRLKRVAAFYGAYPQFFLTSATIGNPRQLAERVIEAPVSVIAQDGSPRGPRHILLYNPPIVHPELGIRRGASSEAIRLTGDLLAYQVQTILFARARRSVELMLRNLREKQSSAAAQIRGYRSGYLAGERRAIEQDLRSGQARAVVATNALELGIDIGGLDAAILVGYPGTIAATRQQSGRAGRRSGTALAILVASASPLDQFLMKHPEYIFDQTPEQALIDPDNLLILLAHLRCAAFELPLRKGEAFGNAPQSLTDGLLTVLEQAGDVHLSNNRYFWTADQYPAQKTSLRTTEGGAVLLQAEQEDGRLSVIGEVDESSAHWMVHPDAIYLHEGQEFEVQELDLERHLAVLKPVSVDYYTEPVKNLAIEKIASLKQAKIECGTRNYGEILVTTQVTGYRRIRWGSMEVLGEGSLELPPTHLRTMAFWLALDESTIDLLREQGQWNNDPNQYGPNWTRQRNLARQRDQFTCQVCGAVEQDQSHHVHHKKPFRSFLSFIEANQLDNLITLCPNCHKLAEQSIRMRSGLAGLGYVLQHLAPLFLMCDINDIGLSSEPQSTLADGQPAVALYDMIPAGIGLSERLFEIYAQLLQNALELVSSCSCPDGCPSCVGPAGENGVGGKVETLALLRQLVGNNIAYCVVRIAY